MQQMTSPYKQANKGWSGWSVDSGIGRSIWLSLSVVLLWVSHQWWLWEWMSHLCAFDVSVAVSVLIESDLVRHHWIVGMKDGGAGA